MNRLIIILLLFVSCHRNDSIEIYDGGNWEKCYDNYFPGGHDRYMPSSLGINDTLIYGFGNYPAFGDKFIFNDLWLYSSEGWAGLDTFPGKYRTEPVLFVLQNKIFCGLGKNIRASLLGSPLKDLWSYDVEKKTWDSVEYQFPGKERTGGLIYGVDGKIYYGAGVCNDEVLNDMYTFDLQNGWQQAEPFYVEPQAHATVFTLDNEIYSCFGKGEQDYFYTIRKLDKQQNKWQTVYVVKKEERLAVARTGAKSFVLKEKEGEFAYIIDGKPSSDILEEDFWRCVRYNPRTNVLERVNAPNVKSINAAFAIENVGYIFDGEYRWKFIP